MLNPVQNFLKNQCSLLWNGSGIIATGRNGDQDSSIMAIASAIHANIALGLNAQEEWVLLKKIYPYEDHPVLNASVTNIRTFIRTKWFNTYVASHPDQNWFELATFAQNMDKRKSYLYKDQTHFFESLSGYYHFSQSVPLLLKPVILNLCAKYPKVFAECGDPQSRGFFLANLIRKNDPLLLPCLNNIAAIDKDLLNPLKAWIDVQRKLHTLPLDSTLRDLHRLHCKKISGDWIRRTLRELFFFTDMHIPEFALIAFEQNPSFFDFYYFLRVGYYYDHSNVNQKFPQETSLPFADLSAKPSKLSPEKHTRYGTLFYQSVFRAAERIDFFDWNFDQLVAFWMLRRNFMAIALDEEVSEIAVPGPFPGKGLQTRLPVNSNLQNGQELRAQIGPYHYHHSTIVMGSEEMIVQHSTDPQMRQSIMEGVGRLFEEAKTELDPAELTKKLGVIFWWIVRSKFWLDGEVEIAEGVVRSLALQKKAPLMAWKPDVVPLEQVMGHLDPAQFGDNFHKFFIAQ